MKIPHTKAFVITAFCVAALTIAIVIVRAHTIPFVSLEDATSSGNFSSSTAMVPDDPQKPEQEQYSVPTPISVSTELEPEPEEIFVEDFSAYYSVQEVASIGKSGSPGWWLSSGAYFKSANGVGSTALGSLSSIDPRRIAYFFSNPIDTDDGYHPQNIFRLVLTRDTWQDFQQEAYFRIVNINTSASPNRNASNGLLFFNRYQDASNLYYTGIRVDGAAVIKKKINETYYTLAYKPFYNTDVPYDRDTNPNILPTLQWVGLRSVIKTNQDATVNIQLFIDKDRTGNWKLAAEARDDGISYGGATISEGYAGIRTDFMDVEFDDYRIEKQ